MGAVAIALLNQKGGVGKSSTCHHVAGTLTKIGRWVLLRRLGVHHLANLSGCPPR
jgi:cellulose biosynthesis protein BcsQ